MGNSRQQKMIGRSLRRLEDARFLTGRGRYVDDIDVADCLYGHVLRSPHAHALIKRIDVSPAAALAGVPRSTPMPTLRPRGWATCRAWRR